MHLHQINFFPGSARVFENLCSAHMANRLPHALLIQSGEGGTGLLLAMQLAQFVHCTGNKVNQPCGTCDACHKHEQLVHPDLLLTFPVAGSKEPTSEDFNKEFRQAFSDSPFMDLNAWMGRVFQDENKLGNIYRAETRRIISRLGLKPYESDYKIQIIWCAELLGDTGNALLKLIEEPPHKTYFFLVTYQPDRILATIRSRCQSMVVPAVLPSETQAWLEHTGIEPSQAEQIAFMAEGNLLKAQSLSQEIAQDYTSEVREWMLACYGLKTQEMLNWSNKQAGIGREQLKQLLIHTLQILREAMLVRFQDAYTPRVSSTHREFVRKFSKLLDDELIQEIYRRVNDHVYFIERNANPKIALFQLSLEIKNLFRAKRLA